MPSFKELRKSTVADERVEAITIEIKWYESKGIKFDEKQTAEATRKAKEEGYSKASQYLKDQLPKKSVPIKVPKPIELIFPDDEVIIASKSPRAPSGTKASYDPFISGWERVEAAQAKGTQGKAIFFGALRDKGKSKHYGADIPCLPETPIQVPAERVILIGKLKDDPHAGNMLVFFVPDEKKPYFVALLHLSENTFKQLSKLKIKLGDEINRKEGINTIIAYTGDTGSAQGHPHLHVTAMDVLNDPEFTAVRFQGLYQGGHLKGFLKGQNFASITTPERKKDSKSLVGYLNPVDLKKDGLLVITTLAPSVQLARTDPEKSGDAVRP